MKMSLTACVFAFLLLSGCQKEYVKVPYYQPIVISDPSPATPLVLRNPDAKVMSSQQILAEVSKTTNPSQLWVLQTIEQYSEQLLDDVDKLEYTKHETYRADYYKNAIQEYNKNVDKLNSKVDKKL